jgi:hypothetical protein
MTAKCRFSINQHILRKFLADLSTPKCYAAKPCFCSHLKAAFVEDFTLLGSKRTTFSFVTPRGVDRLC